MTSAHLKPLRWLAAPSLLAASCFSQAWTVDESPRTVVLIGSHIVSTGFLQIAEALPATCTNSVLYFDLATPLGKAMYTTLALAKATGQKVRLGYTPPASLGICTLELVALL